MEWLRKAANPWGQEVILGIGWDLFWAAVVVGAVFVLAHALLIVRLRRAGGGGGSGDEAATSAEADREDGAGDAVGINSRPSLAGRAGADPRSAGVPEKVTRHNLASRLFHWSMAGAMFALLITGFVPVMGLDFDWVPLHWIAGLVLVATVAYHVVHAVFFQSLKSVWVGLRDVREGATELTHLLRGESVEPPKTGKYPVANKLYHHAAAAAALVAIVTGLVMMVRIDTPVFEQNQYLLADGTWGWVYLLHGVAGVALVVMVIAHVYFAVRPEKWWQTRSMIRGWITREEYVTHHDPERWPLEEEDPGIESPPARPAVEQGAT